MTYNQVAGLCCGILIWIVVATAARRAWRIANQGSTEMDDPGD